MSENEYPAVGTPEDWFVRVPEGRIHGPYSTAHMAAAFQNGTLGDRFFVRQGSTGEWLLPSEVAGLLSGKITQVVKGPRSESTRRPNAETSTDLGKTLQAVVDAEPRRSGLFLGDPTPADPATNPPSGRSISLRFLAGSIIVLAVVGLLITRAVSRITGG